MDDDYYAAFASFVCLFFALFLRQTAPRSFFLLLIVCTSRKGAWLFMVWYVPAKGVMEQEDTCRVSICSFFCSLQCTSIFFCVVLLVLGTPVIYKLIVFPSNSRYRVRYVVSATIAYIWAGTAACFVVFGCES